MVFGTDLYGGVDQVGETSIKTKFFHIGTIPLIPLDSYYFLEGSEEKTNNFNILVYQSKGSSFSSVEYNGLNTKSVIIGYVRYISGFLAFLGISFFLVFLFGDKIFSQNILFLFILAILLLIPFYLTYKLGVNKNIEDIITRQFSEKYFGIGFNPDNIKKNMAQSIIETIQEIFIENEINIDDVLENIDKYNKSVIGLLLLKLKSEAIVNTRNSNTEKIDNCMRKLKNGL